MTLDEIIKYVGQQATTLLLPENKAIFKEKLDPYFKRVTDFKKGLDEHVQRLKALIDKGKIDSKLINMGQDVDAPIRVKVNSKNNGLVRFLKDGEKLTEKEKKCGIKAAIVIGEENPIEKVMLSEGYIRCSNLEFTTTPSYFDVYYPFSKYGHIWGWIPKDTYQDNPLDQLLIKATGAPQDNDKLLLFQFAIVAILYDAVRLNDGCSLIYFGNGNELADRTALAFMQTLKIYTRDYTGYQSDTTKRIINRLKNAVDTILIELENHRKQNDNTGESERLKTLTETTEPILKDEELTLLIDLAANKGVSRCRVAIKAATNIKESTLKKMLKKFEELKLANRPNGQRGGYAITDKGWHTHNKLFPSKV